jgi:Domain of unknown function (DUF4272)
VANDEANTDSEAFKRRKRTEGYLKLWNIETDLSVLPVPLESSVHIPTADLVAGRAKALCLVALKGQGLSQYETFAFSDGYEVWDHLTIAEHDFVLDPSPPPHDLVQYAWRYEGMLVMLWALSLTKHLGFPVDPYDSAKAVERCMQGVLLPFSEKKPLPDCRSTKELLDARDVANALNALALAVPDQPAPAGLHRGVVYERHLAFTWLTAERAQKAE